MAGIGGKKEHPLSMRFPVADIDMIDRAASIKGRSRTDFVREAAVRAAEDALMDHVATRLSPDAYDAFLAALSGPATPVPEMVKVLRRAAPWEAKANKSGA